MKFSPTKAGLIQKKGKTRKMEACNKKFINGDIMGCVLEFRKKKHLGGAAVPLEATT